VGALLMADMAHVSGLVAAGLAPSPFELCDIVTTTTHKTLRGPRAGLIFFRKGVRSVDRAGKDVLYDLEDRINQAVFPGLQGGPHNHAIGGVACALLLAQSGDFRQYQTQVVENARRLAAGLTARGYKLVTGGTDNHMVWLDLRGTGLTGAKGELLLETAAIACNKNTVPGDKSALNPSGLRLGTPALTSRGLTEQHFDTVVDFIDKALLLAREVVAVSGVKMVDFRLELAGDKFSGKAAELRTQVEQFAAQFPLPGLADY